MYTGVDAREGVLLDGEGEVVSQAKAFRRLVASMLVSCGLFQLLETLLALFQLLGQLDQGNLHQLILLLNLYGGSVLRGSDLPVPLDLGLLAGEESLLDLNVLKLHSQGPLLGLQFFANTSEDHLVAGKVGDLLVLQGLDLGFLGSQLDEVVLEAREETVELGLNDVLLFE